MYLNLGGFNIHQTERKKGREERRENGRKKGKEGMNLISSF